MKVYSSGT